MFVLLHCVCAITLCLCYYIVFVLLHCVCAITLCWCYYIVLVLLHCVCAITLCLCYYIVFVLLHCVGAITLCWCYTTGTNSMHNSIFQLLRKLTVFHSSFLREVFPVASQKIQDCNLRQEFTVKDLHY